MARLWPKLLLHFGQNKGPFMLFLPFLGHSLCLVVNLETFVNNLSELNKNPKNAKEIKKNSLRNVKNTKKNNKVPEEKISLFAIIFYLFREKI